jgi:hypothetical protein
MRVTEQSLHPNLRRGGIEGTAASARRAREAKASIDAEGKRLGNLAKEDPYAAFDEMHAIMTMHTLKLLRAEERSSGKPAREVTDRLREYRQLTEALARYRSARGELEGTSDFFATIEERMVELQERFPCSNCGHTEHQVKPAVDIPEGYPRLRGG